MANETHSWSGNFKYLNHADQIAVAQLVVRGRAIVGTVEDVLFRLGRTRCVALLRQASTNGIVGVAAWKQPTAAYRRGKFTSAGVPIAGFETAPELGYVVIAPAMRGKRLSGGLIDVIVQKITESTFATTASNTIRDNLERSGFTRVGQDWRGENGMLSLWTIAR